MRVNLDRVKIYALEIRGGVRGGDYNCIYSLSSLILGRFKKTVSKMSKLESIDNKKALQVNTGLGSS